MSIYGINWRPKKSSPKHTNSKTSGQSSSSSGNKSNEVSLRSKSADSKNKTQTSNRLKKADKKPNFNKFKHLSSEYGDEEQMETESIWGDPLDSQTGSQGRNRSQSPRERHQKFFSPIRPPKQ